MGSLAPSNWTVNPGSREMLGIPTQTGWDASWWSQARNPPSHEALHACCLPALLRVIFVQAKVSMAFLAWCLRFPSWEPAHAAVTRLSLRWLQALTSLLLPGQEDHPRPLLCGCVLQVGHDHGHLNQNSYNMCTRPQETGFPNSPLPKVSQDPSPLEVV